MPFDLPSTVRMQTTQAKGREFVATSHVSADETLFRVYPYAVAIFESFRKRVCAYCSCPHPARAFSMHCKACDQVYFCSAACADAYLPHHDAWICTALRKLATLKKVGRHERSVAQLVLLVHWQRRCCLPPFDTNHARVDALESHYLDWDDDLKQDYRRIQTFLTAQLPDESPVEIMHLVSRIESNGFGVHLDSRKEPVGRALFPIVSMFNHDCGCNCEAEQTQYDDDVSDELQQQLIPQPNGEPDKVVQLYPDVFRRPHGHHRSMKITALRDIQPGEPLTISYVDSSLPVAARRRRLLEEYFFECTCTRCSAELAQTSSRSSKKKRN